MLWRCDGEGSPRWAWTKLTLVEGWCSSNSFLRHCDADTVWRERLKRGTQPAAYDTRSLNYNETRSSKIRTTSLWVLWSPCTSSAEVCFSVWNDLFSFKTDSCKELNLLNTQTKPDKTSCEQLHYRCYLISDTSAKTISSCQRIGKVSVIYVQ